MISIYSYSNVLTKHSTDTSLDNLSGITHCFSFRGFDSPDAPVCQRRILPQWFSLVSHEVKVASQLQVRHVRDVVVDAPERLDRGDCVNLLQVSFVFSKC